MDSDSHSRVQTGGDWWTDEKHLHFLEALEYSFLRTMFENANPYAAHTIEFTLPLDRHLPDSHDSTRDSECRRRRGHRNLRTRKTTRFSGIGRRPPAKKSRRNSLKSRDSSSNSDQVVPQLVERAAADDEQDPTSPTPPSSIVTAPRSQSRA